MDSQRNAPIYNIKAVARLTGVPADTLRRWESRYGIISPQRTDSGYRLYSQRDVDTLTWLKGRLEEGLSISSACEMLRQMGGDPGGDGAGGGAISPVSGNAEVGGRAQGRFAQDGIVGVRSGEVLREELVDAFRKVDEGRAGEVLNEAIALYPLDDVCMEIIQPSLVEIGELWLEGKVTVAVEHFASSFVRSRLANLFHSSPHSLYGPLVLVGCAQEEYHELGAMLLALFLRRAGFRVVYLGQNVPMESLQGMIKSMQPEAVCISATRTETAGSLYQLREFLKGVKRDKGRAPVLAYGGQVFNKFPHIAERLGGIYLGEDARVGVQKLSERLRADKGG